MTIEEATRIASIIKVAFPNAYNNLSKEDAINMIKLWQMQFEDISYKAVSMAVNSYIATNTSGFPPVIAQIKEIIFDLSNPNQLTDNDAWLLVRQACRNSLYNANEEFKKLPPSVQRVIGSPNVLRQYAEMDSSEMQFIGNQFKKDFKAVVQREKENACLPLSIKKTIGISHENALQIEGEETWKK